MKFLVRTIYILTLACSIASVNAFEEVTQDLESLNLQRIIGGKIAQGNEYPWFTDLGACAGSLVSPEYVLTAAHCHERDILERVTIGKVCKRHNNCGHPKERRRVERFILHPDYNKYNGSNDLMLVKLRSRVQTKPVQMDDEGLSFSYESGHDNLWTAGFGYIDFHEKKRPFYLQHIPLSYLDNDSCDLEYQEDDWEIREDMMCAVNEEDRSKQACFGDSGGPLYDKSAEKLVGVTSWGDDSCSSKTVVYSRIADQIEWITSTICEIHSHPKPTFCNPPTMEPSPEPSVEPSISTQPSLSVYPSISPSISYEPSFSRPTQNIYFHMIARTDMDTNICVEAGDDILLQECDKNNKKQLWRADAVGQLRSFLDEEYCLTHIRRSHDNRRNLAMHYCVENHARLSEIFLFNGFQNSILYLKSNVDWQEYGLKAISARNVTIGSLVTLEWHYYGDFSSGFSQVWDIEYPNIQLPANSSE